MELPRFTGSEEHALDEKGRLIVPARFRKRLGQGFVHHDRPARSVPGPLPDRHVGAILPRG